MATRYWDGEREARKSRKEGRAGRARYWGNTERANPPRRKVSVSQAFASSCPFAECILDQNEFKEDIKQTKTELKAEQDEIRAKNERDRIAKQEYAEIGFEDTEEALQYAIMMSREEDRSTADGALSQSTDEREFQEMLAEIAKMEARDGGGDVVGSSSKSVQPATESAPTRGNNASGIMTEEQELQIALEQIQAAEAREAAERRASRG